MQILKEKYNNLVNEYLEAFVGKYYTFDDGSKADTYWVTNDIGGVAEIGDEFYNFSDIKYCVDNDVTKEQLFSWYDYTLRVKLIDHNFPTPNLKSWIAGCPRLSDQEIDDLEYRQHKIRALQHEFEELCENYKKQQK